VPSVDDIGGLAGPDRASGQPRFAAIDPRRFSAQAPVGQKSSFVLYAWIPGAAVDAAEQRPAGAATASVSDRDRRFGPEPLLASLDRFSTALTIVLALAQPDELTGVALTAQAPGGDTAAGADEGSAPVALAMAVPLPRPRPKIALGASAERAQRQASMPQTDIVPAPRPAHSAEKKTEPHRALAYADPDTAAEEETSGGIFSRLMGGRGSARLPGAGSKVAVYDISAATVYMPNGEKLEAHSGLAHMQDDPRYITEKNRGPTPPNLYNLVMRESRFHGVQAIRLLPADGRKKFNRDGLLAHTYMYAGGGSRSQSNGCVVFKKYERFLTAFKNGEIERLIVVPSMEKLPTYLAAL
jgi:hypothetical protein